MVSKYPDHPTQQERDDTERYVRERVEREQRAADARREAQRKPQTPDDGSAGYPIGGHQNGRP